MFYSLSSMFYVSCFKKKGVASLVTVITLGSLIFIISLSTSIIAYYSNQNVASSFYSQKAFYASYSGIQDALLKLQRNKDYSSTSYNISVNSSNDSTISVSNSSGTATITSTSTVSNTFISKKIQAIVEINQTTGLITPTSTLEQTL